MEGKGIGGWVKGRGWAGKKQPWLLFPSFFSETLIKTLQREMRDAQGRMERATRGDRAGNRLVMLNK